MDRNRRNKKHSNWNNQKNNHQNKNIEQNVKKFEFNHTNYEDHNLQREKEKAIAEIKSRQVLCSKCGQIINDIASCINDKDSNTPIHFECALKVVESQESLLPNEKIAYIGHGRFGILAYDNIRDQRHFTIKKVIEWENKEIKSEWREELSNLYSKIN